MATLDRNFTDELRMRLSIVDVVGRRVPLTRKGQNYWGCCPFHNSKSGCSFTETLTLSDEIYAP